MAIERRLGVWLGMVWICSSACSAANDQNSGPGSQLPIQPGVPQSAINTATGATNTPGGPTSGGVNAAPVAGGAGSAAPAGSANPGAVMNPGMGMGGAIAPPKTTAPTPVTGTTAMPVAGKMAMDECGLHTKYPGDEYCILPPPADKGFQLHIGPSNYDNPESQYILPAGAELTSSFSAVSGNATQKYFYYRQFRMRPGAHHNIITSGSSGGLDFGGGRIGTSNNLSEDDPKGGVIAPENMDVGVPIGAMTSISVSLHSINTTQKTELRELWVNFWYVDDGAVKEPVQEMFQVGDPLLSVDPGADVILGPYSCTLSGDGRLLWFYGHRHANNVRFSAWRIRGTQKDLFYEGLNWEEPLVLEYSSTVMNPVPDEAKGVEGGWSGILDIKTGDQFQWECHVVNKTTGTLHFTNNTYTGEMCIMDAELVGANCL